MELLLYHPDVHTVFHPILDFQFEVPASGHFTKENVDAEKHPDIKTQGKRVKNEFKHGPSGRGVLNG